MTPTPIEPFFLSEWKVKARNHYNYVINLHTQRSSSQRIERCFSHVIPSIRIANDVFSPVRKMIRPIRSHRGGEFLRQTSPHPRNACTRVPTHFFLEFWKMKNENFSSISFFLFSSKWKWKFFYFFFSEKNENSKSTNSFSIFQKMKMEIFQIRFSIWKKERKLKCYEWNHGK